jgi:hypothetical protein
MPRKLFDTNAIRSAGDDPAPGTHAGAFRTYRIDRYLDGSPAEWRAGEDAESARASFAAPIRNADAGWHLVTRARAPHQQAAPL